MKLLKIAAAGLFALSLHTTTVQAQVNINITPPSWGPAVGPNTQYYYIPEVDGYYDVRDRQYVVQREGRWSRVRNAGYDTRTFHPVVVDYVGAQPWVRIEEYRTKYKGHPHGMPPGQAKKMRSGQTVIVNQNAVYEGNSGNGKGNGKGNGNGKGHGNGKNKH
ncbi:hypothetical protein LGH70_20720 [Hymenobacter sp. BT635]|uniref:Uncharacterized protein n=1 Tax=Hymenobacter nitidus TaxID=2880929 RepID=A0ABS8ALB9_9BACT|nr:hypothetical protein [Hymenobacter nitidus]MCB2380030.1 hypothetical protein [Hymenobacter nitidus]